MKRLASGFLSHAVILCLGVSSAAAQGGGDTLPVTQRAGHWLEVANATAAGNRLPDFEHAVPLFRRAIELARAQNDITTQAGALVGLAGVFRALAEADSALAYASDCVKLLRAHSWPGLSGALGQLAVIYAEVRRVDSALVYANQTLEACKVEPGCTLAGYLTAELVDLGVLDTSFIPVLKNWETVYRARSEWFQLSAVYNALGSLFFWGSRYDSALVYHRRAQWLRPSDRPTLFGLGITFRALRNVDSASFYFNRLASSSRARGDARGEARAMGNLGGICHRDLAPPDVGCALAYYDSSFSAATRVLEAAGSGLNRAVYAEQAVELVDAWVMAWLAARDSVGDDVAIPRSLAVAEMGRAQTLQRLVEKAHPETRPEVASEGLQRATQLAIGSVDSGSAVLSYLVTFDTLIVWLSTPNERTRVYRLPITYDSLASLVGSLRTQLGADNALAGTRLRGGSALAHVVDLGLASTFTTVAAALADVVIPADLPERVPRGADLVVVPNGALWLVPFGLLPLRGGETLIDRFAVRYAPSLTLAGREVPRNESVAHGFRHVLVVANPKMPKAQIEPGLTVTLAQLPGAEREGDWVARRLDGQLLSGAVATETRVQEAMPGADVIHFATHGLAYKSINWSPLSFLAFAADSMSDGTLTVAELLRDNRPLSASLAVLSGCQTGLGDVRFSEGTLGLQWAFLARGVQSVLVSLWSVSDEATEQLMRHFYGHWLDDADRPSKSEALRRAQLDMRQSAAFAHPIYWSSFQLVGAR